MECEAGRLHQNSEHCRVDFLPWLPRYGGPQRGRMLVTVFHNPWFHVLRFDIGDVARLDEGGPCPCGRDRGLTLAAIEGRVADVTFTSAGQVVTVDDLDVVLSQISGLTAWQLDLPADGTMRLRITAEAGAARQACRNARELLHGIYGNGAAIEVAVEKALLQENSGKFRFCRSDFCFNHEILWSEKNE